MKKIISGKVYDTGTATFIARDDNGLGKNDFQWLEEALYRKRTGEYFLHGKGGALTYCASPISGGYTSGEKIVPLTYAGARKWAEEHLDADEYLTIFEADPDESESVIMTVQLKASTRAKLEHLQSKKGKSMSAIIDEAVERL